MGTNGTNGTVQPPTPPSLEDVPMPDWLRDLVSNSTPRFFHANHVLITEGADDGGSLFVVLAGRVHAYSTKTQKKGSRRITYGEYLPGELLGEMSLDGGKRAATVKTMVPSWCCVLTHDEVMSRFRTDPEFAFELLKRVIRRARAATLSLKQIALEAAYGRIAHLLQSRATARADGRLALSISDQNIADVVGCSRPMVHRIFKELLKGGYVGRDGGQVVLMKKLPPRYGP